jgi:hypothetical protein
MLSRLVRTSTSRRSLAPEAPTNQKSEPGSWHGALAMPSFTPSLDVVVLVPTVPAASGPTPRINSGAGLVTGGDDPILPRTSSDPAGSAVSASGAIVSGVSLPAAVGVPSGSVGDTALTTLDSLPPPASAGQDNAVRFTTARAGSSTPSARVTGSLACVRMPSPAAIAIARTHAPSRIRASASSRLIGPSSHGYRAAPRRYGGRSAGRRSAR